ncbi:hypothetical protein FRC03_003627 [Tulasnella sp. 419]|nr:hypothetical protein FRC03_003627 [Tulasnella sp. 419]
MDATPKVAATQGAPRMVYGKSNNKAANSHKPRHTSSNQPAFVFSTDAQEVVARHPRPSSGVGPSVPRTLHVTPLSRTPNISHPSEHSAPHPPPIRVDDEMVNTAKLMRRRQNLLDYGYASPPSQAKFSKESYLRKGWLVDLVTLLKDDVSHRRPIAVGDLDASMTLSDFDDRVPAIFDELHDWTKGLNDVPEARAKMRFMCLYVSWISQQPSLNDDMNRVSAMIDDATMHLLRRLDLEGDAKADSEENMLWVAWFALEISLRLWRIRHCQDPIFSGAPLASKTPADLALVFLLQRLHRFGFDRTMDCVNRCDDVSEESQFECASAELWICLIHLTHALYPNDPSSFWDQLRSSHLHSHCAKVSLQSSECVWKSIFTVLAISRFSMTGVVLSESHIQPSWSIVTFGLSSVRLKVDVEEDHRLPSDIVKSRDVYHRLLLSRCWHLATHFKWSLNDPYALFKLLVDMFRSRSFGSLLGEEADFPSFIRHGRLETAFSDPNKKCTAIGLFIKLILRAAHDIENDPARAQDPTESANWWKKVKRLTNPLIPVGSTSFTKEAPPVGNELSKLYNRFSLAIAAIRLEHWNTDFRLLKAKDYQDFKKADVNSRTACIRALMQIGIVLRQQDKDVSKLMVWYGELLQVLLEEGSKEPEQGGNTGEQTHAKEMLAMLALQLLRALRTVLETVPAEDTRYPDPVFIENAQLDHILRSPFANDPRISTEIREYIFTFLQLRRAAVPARTEPHAPVPVISNNESQESDEFGDLALDFEDPYMHTLLGERQPLEWEIKDQRVAAFLKASLSPALFAYFQKHFDEVRKQSVASNSHDDQIWVECWVECIDVMARNHMKAWEDYQEWGSESLDRIPLSVNTNHLSLHFLLAAIRIDPTAYSKTKEWMITIWISSLGTSRHSSERYQYSHLIFEADGHNHPLLRNIDITDALDREVGTEEHRLSLLTGVVGNMASLMQAGSVPAKDQHFVTSGINGIIGALSLMKEEFIELKNLGPAEHVPIIQQRQARFSQDFVQQLKAVPAIWENRRISNAAAWSSN